MAPQNRTWPPDTSKTGRKKEARNALGDARDVWLEALTASNASPFTVKGYRSNLVPLLRFLSQAGVEAPADITPFLLRRFLADYGQGHAPDSVRSVYTAVRAWLRWLAREEMIPASPTDKVAAPRTPQKAKDVYSPGQLRAALKALEGIGRLGLCNLALVSVLIDTGCRRGELLDATLDDVDDGALLLRQTKAKRPRMLPLGEKAQRALSAYLRRGRLSFKPRGNALWLRYDGVPFTDGGLRMMLQRLSGLVGFHLSAHKFRHTWASMMLRRGVDLETLRRLGGWADYAMLRTYAHLTTDDLKEAHRRVSPLDRPYGQADSWVPRGTHAWWWGGESREDTAEACTGALQ